MKIALVILSAYLLALSPPTSAQTNNTLNPITCAPVRNLSSQCMTAFNEATSGENQAVAFCSGRCFGLVLTAYERCDSDGAAAVVQQLREGEK